MRHDGSDRGGYAASLIAGLIAFGILCGTLAYTFQLGDISGRQEAEAYGYATEYPESTAKSIDICFQKRELTNPQECVEQAIASSRESQRGEYDLNAQRNMAEWAFWLLVITSFGLVITIIATIGLYKQINLTREAVEDTGHATEAMLDSNKIARETGRKQVRAYLGVKSVTLDDGEDLNKPRFTVEIENKGVSPAIVYRVSATVIWMGAASGDPYVFSRKIDLECGIKEYEGKGFFVLSGIVHYTDVFEDCHMERFDHRTSGREDLFDMIWPVRMPAFPLKVMLNELKTQQGKKETEGE